MRETLVTDNLSWARKIGCHAARRVPTRVSRDDLAQEATLGLMEAARRFDASLGVGFRAFAGRHVKERATWLILQNADHRVVNSLMGQRRGRCEGSRAAVLFKR